MRHFKRGVSYFSRLLSENSAKKPFLRGKLRLALRRDLADKNISCTDLRSDSYDSSLVEIFQSVVAHAGHVSCYLFGSELGIPCLSLILLYMNRRIYVVSHKSFAQKNGVLVVIALPGHEADKGVLSESDLSIARRGAVGNNLARLDGIAFSDDGLLIIAVALVAS